jgi:hypothetical protein
MKKPHAKTAAAWTCWLIFGKTKRRKAMMRRRATASRVTDGDHLGHNDQNPR